MSKRSTLGVNGPRGLRTALHVLVVLAFVTGGSSQISGWDDTFVQLASLPVLAWGLWHVAQLPPSQPRTLALVAALLIVLVPLLQLLPVPEALWHLPVAREALARDLATVGVVPDYRWSLAPAATERAVLFLLPPMGAFMATLATGFETHRRLLRLIMLLAMASLLLGFVQLGVPEESLLNPFPRWHALFNGLFANRNHQGISVVIALIIAEAGALVALGSVREGLKEAWTPWVLGFVALFALCALPLTGSRAAVLIAVFAVATVPIALGLFDRAHLRSGWGARAGLAACLVLIGLGLWATLGWMQVEAVDEVRPLLRSAALAVGVDHAPLGAGMGAFVPAFEQGASPGLMLRQYINHAHNEYLQWWVEAGWLGMLALLVVLATLCTAGLRALRERGHRRVPGLVALMGLGALLLHSWVDYPMRTVSLATVAAVLAGIVVAQAARVRPHRAIVPVGEAGAAGHTF